MLIQDARCRAEGSQVDSRDLHLCLLAKFPSQVEQSGRMFVLSDAYMNEYKAWAWAKCEYYNTANVILQQCLQLRQLSWREVKSGSASCENEPLERDLVCVVYRWPNF